MVNCYYSDRVVNCYYSDRVVNYLYAMRHIHMSPSDALRLGVRDRYSVRVVVEGDRELVFGDVLVRVSPGFQLAMHIDTDEANAANVRTGAQGHLHSIQSRH